jgi:hypothetical protein
MNTERSGRSAAQVSTRLDHHSARRRLAALALELFQTPL